MEDSQERILVSEAEAFEWFFANKGPVRCDIGGVTRVCNSFSEAKSFFHFPNAHPGLQHRYDVFKANGEPIDEGAEYFVLRLDDGGDDKAHINACREAIRYYATLMQFDLPALAQDIWHKYGPSSLPAPPKDFKEALTRLINQYSMENGSNTPDFILANYLNGCLIVFDTACRTREGFYGTKLKPGNELLGEEFP